MNILLTGATGFIGNYLRFDLIQNHHVYAIARKSFPVMDEKELTWVRADLSLPCSITDLPPTMDAVIYLAQSRDYRQFPDRAGDIFNVNVQSVLTLLEYARRSGVHTFIFTSTANVYRLCAERISESWIVEPTSFYARTKSMAEILIEGYAKYFSCIVLRLFTVYGPGQKAMLIPNLIERVRYNNPIQVQGRQGFMTSPIYVDDVKDVVLKFLEREKISPGYEIFNVGGDEMVGIHDLGLIIGNVLNLKPRIDYIVGDEPKGWAANNSKLKAALYIKKFISIRDGIKRSLA